MPEFLNLINALATHINTGNIEQAVALVEKLITLVESVKSGLPAQDSASK